MTRILYVNYPSIEAEFALQLTADLKNGGIGVWMDRLQLPATADWTTRSSQALERSSGMLVILSPEWFRAHYCQREYSRARTRGLALFAVTLRPIGEHEYPPGLDSRRVLDFSEWRAPGFYREAYKRILTRLKEDSREWLQRPSDDETRFLVQVVARMEAQQGTLEYATSGERSHVSADNPQRMPPALSALWGSASKVTALDKVRYAPTAEPRWRRTTYTDLKSAVAARPRAILLGGPGTGKTSALQRLTLDAARARLADDSLPVPLYVNLVHWREEQDFESFLVSRAPMLRNVVDMAAEGTAILYIDGLNEVTQKVDVRLMQIRAWLSSERGPKRVLFACRTRAYDDALELDLPLLELEPLDEQGVWNVVHALVGEVQAEAAYRRIYAPESTYPMEIKTRELASNPTFLSGLVFLYKASPESALPSTLGGLLKRWMASAWIWRRMQNMPGWIPYVDVEAALAKIAFRIIQQDLPTGLSYNEALDLVGNDKLLRAAQNAGLVEFEADSIAFRQPLLAEYFAAVGAQSYPMSARLEPPHFNAWGERIASRWDQVFIIQAGLTPNADMMIGEIGAVDPFLAAQVLAGGVEASQDAHEQVVSLLVDITHFVTGEGRLAAVRALADLDHPDALTALLDVMRSGTWQVRQAANWQLHRLPLPLPKKLFDAVSDWNWSMDERVSAALRQVGVQALPLLLQVLRDEHWTRRRGAAWALGEIHDAAAVPGLVEALGDDESMVRREAARSLRLVCDVDSLPMLLDALHDADGRVREAVLEAVVAFKESAIDGLSDLLRDPVQAVRVTAAKALAQIGLPEAGPHLLVLLKDPSPEIRGAAVVALGKLRYAPAAQALRALLHDSSQIPGQNVRVGDLATSALTAIEGSEGRAVKRPPQLEIEKETVGHKMGSAHDAKERLPGRSHASEQERQATTTQLAVRLADPNWRVRKLAVERFAEQPLEARIPALLHALQDEDDQVRFAAVRGLGGIEDEKVIYGLIERLSDSEHLVADAAAAALGRLGGAAVPSLLNALHDDDVNVRGRAVEALAIIADPTSVPRLAALLEDSAVPAMETEPISARVALALERIGSDQALAVLEQWRRSRQPASAEMQPEPAWDEALDENSDLPLYPEEPVLPYGEDDYYAIVEPFDHDDLPLSYEVEEQEETVLSDVMQRELERMILPLHQPTTIEAQFASRELRDYARQISGVADSYVVQSLMALLSDPTYLVRWTATEALAWLKHPLVPGALASMLMDDNVTIRLAALRGLYEHASPDVLNAVSRAVQDESEFVRETAAEVLGRLGETAAPALLNALKDREGFVRRAAAEALGNTQSRAPVVINALINALDDEEFQVRCAVVEALGKLNAEGAVRPLAKLLNVRDVTAWEPRPFAAIVAEALERIGTKDAFTVLELYRADERKRQRGGAG